MKNAIFLRTTALMLLLPALAACSIGPDFQRPRSGLPTDWGSPPADAAGAAADADWWHGFDDPVLNCLVHDVSAANLDLQSAASRVQQSRALRGGVAADRLPAVSAQGGYTRARSSGDGLLDPSDNNGRTAYDVASVGLDAAWELDLWGRARRETEAADARVDVARETARALLLSVTAETVSDYLRLRGVQNAIAITEQNRALARHSLALTQIRQEEGVATTVEVAEAAARAAEIAARLAPLRQQEAALIGALGLLLAQPPGAASLAPLHSEAGSDVAMPAMARLPAFGLPSALAERRPDIRRAEAALHAATADIGVAQGDFYPRITLSGDVGFQALQLSDLGSWGSHAFSFGPGLTLPLFDGGRLRSIVQLKQARQQEAALDYRRTVLTAWHEVDDAMTAYRASGQRRDFLADAVEQSRRAWTGAQQQYEQGAIDFVNVLAVQNTLLNNELALSDSRLSSSLALVALYKALGGGWQ